MAAQVIPVASQVDAIVARSLARAFARATGLSTDEAAEIAIVVAELGSNLWRHGRSGEIRLSEAVDGRRRGVLVEAEDHGPGLSEDAWRDNFSTGGGLGSGLGAVRRLTDHLTTATGTRGTLIRAWKWKGSTSA